MTVAESGFCITSAPETSLRSLRGFAAISAFLHQGSQSILLFSVTRTLIASAANYSCSKGARAAGLHHLMLEHVVIRFSDLITGKDKNFLCSL